MLPTEELRTVPTEDELRIVLATPLECGAYFNGFVMGEIPVADRVYCNEREHCTYGELANLRFALEREARFVCECPTYVTQRSRRAVAAAIAALGGVVVHLDRAGGHGFDKYDANRHPQAGAALTAMRSYAAGRPPAEGVLLAGPTGIGKTRLLVASHLELVGAGVRSVYVTSAMLRTFFRKAISFDAGTCAEAEKALERITSAEACHVDDLGDVAGDARAPGMFAEGLKALLDSARAPWAVSTNCSSSELSMHPDVGAKNLSRLVEGATVVRMSGEDQRARSTRRG